MSMGRFLPETLRRARLTPQELAHGPVALPEQGALLFADITGFTSLVESLTGNGREEIERFRHTLDAYFGQLIELLSRWGGDVLTFAGDALLALFSDSAGPDALSRAASCALALAAPRGAGSLGTELSLRVAVCHGAAQLALVGGVRDEWHHVLLGEPLLELDSALKSAKAGEVLLCPSAARGLGARALGEPRAGGQFLLHSVAEPAAPHSLDLTVLDEGPLVDAFVSPSLRLWVPTGSARFLGERRRLTPVFLGLPTPRLEEPGWLSSLHDEVRAAQRVVDGFEGSIQQLVADDKGLTLLAAWGLPPGAHEHDAERALEASLELRSSLGELASAVGVATGDAYCGVVGNAQRGAYTMLGTTVNLAARLMHRAVGSVLLDQRTFDAVQRAFSCEPGPPLKLKGLAEAVPVYRPGARRQGELPLVEALLGRGRELAALEAARRELTQQGHGCTLVLEAPAGLGKSTLLGELRRQCEAEGVRVVATAGLAIQRNAPYHALRPLLRALLELRESCDAATLLDAAARCLGPRLQEHFHAMPLLGAVLGVELSAARLELDPEARSQRLRALCLALVSQTATERPLALVLDDAQWFDSASWAVVEALARAELPVLLALGTRPSEAAGHAAAARELPRAQHLALSTVSREMLTELVRRRLRVRAVPAELESFLAERAEGNPYYCQELLASLLDAGQLAVEGDALRVATPNGRIERAAVPSSIGGLISDRLRHLAPEEQLFLKVASTFGLRFDPRVVLAVYPGEKPDGAAVVESLSRRGLLRPSAEGGGAWEFVHMLSSDAIYEGLLLSQRRELHGAALAWFEEHPADPRSTAATLAYHARRAEAWESAVRYLERAGFEALRRYANAEAERALADALAVCDAHGVEAAPRRKASWCAGLAEAHYRLGAMLRAVEHGERALALLGVPMPAEGPSTGAAVLGMLQRRLFNRARDESVAKLPAEDRARALSTLTMLTDAYGFLLRGGPTIVSVLRILAAAEAAERPGDAARSWLMLWFLVSTMGLGDTFAGWWQRAEKLLEREPDLGLRAVLHVRFAGVHWYLGGWATSNEHLSRGRELAARSGSLRTQSEVELSYAQTLLAQGEYARTERVLEALRPLLTITGDGQSVAASGACYAELLARRGRGEEALSALETAEQWSAQNPTAGLLPWFAGVGALASWRAGRHEEALARCDSALTVLEQQQFVTVFHYLGVAALGEALLDALAQGAHGAAASALLRRAERQAERLGRSIRFASALGQLLRGARELEARSRRARRTLEQCLASARTFSLAPVAWRAERALASFAGSPEAERARLDSAWRERVGA